MGTKYDWDMMGMWSASHGAKDLNGLHFFKVTEVVSILSISVKYIIEVTDLCEVV